jgi:hypothetical protein
MLAVSHFMMGLLGVGVLRFLAQRQIPGSGSDLAALGLAWGFAANADPTSCKSGAVPWARSLVAHRAAIGDEDFAVEAAVTLTLLGEHRGDRITDAERRTLDEAAARCPSVLHVPCDGAAFERAVARRCSPPKRHVSKRDGGAEAQDAGTSSSD